MLAPHSPADSSPASPIPHPEAFARECLPDYCRFPFAAFHQTLFEWHTRMGEVPPADPKLYQRRGLRYALAAPRGSAKSTIASLILLAHDVVFEREQYIVLLSATERQARSRLRALSRVLREHIPPKYLADRELKETAGSLTLGNVRIDAYGAGSEIRGLNHHQWRPTKIILDDADPSRSAHSERARERLLQWYSETIEYLGDTYTHILAVGTILHENALLARLLRRPDFDQLTIRAVQQFSPRQDLWEQWRLLIINMSDPDRRQTARNFFEQNRTPMTAGTAVAWPEREDYEELMVQLHLRGRRAFYQEKQNLPSRPEDAIFDPEAALRAVWEDQTLILQTIRDDTTAEVRRYPNAQKTARRFGYLDASLGKGRATGKGDFSALATILLLPDGTCILESLTARRLAPTAQVAQLFERHAERPYETLAIEATGFQELLLLPIEEERKRRQSKGLTTDLPIRTVHPGRGKSARIASLEPALTNGSLALAPDLSAEFWEELNGWPKAQHDDALDAAAGALDIARKAINLSNELVLAPEFNRPVPRTKWY